MEHEKTNVLVSVREASRLLGVSESHIRKMIRRGRFPSYQMGNRIVRVDPNEIKAVTRKHQGEVLGGGGATAESRAGR